MCRGRVVRGGRAREAAADLPMREAAVAVEGTSV